MNSAKDSTVQEVAPPEERSLLEQIPLSIIIICAGIVLVFIVLLIILIVLLLGQKKNPNNDDSKVKESKKEKEEPPRPKPVLSPDYHVNETVMLSGGNGNETSVLDTGSSSSMYESYGTLVRKSNNENCVIDKPYFSIGKDSLHVNFCIKDNSSISRQHASIESNNGITSIKDNNSTNGTFVNNVRLIPGQVDEELVEDVEYTPIAVVPPWEVDCANLWTATGNYAAMIAFINSTPKDANVWTEGTAQAMAIIYQDAVENNNAEVKQAFDNRFQKITYKQTTGTKVVCSNTSATSFNGVEWVTYDNYTYETDPAVIRRMEPYMDIYLNGKAWTSLHETISVSIEQGSNEASERNTTISVTKDTDGNLVTTVSLTDADGNTVISKSVTAYNIWDKMYEEGKLKEMRLAGKTQAQIDEYRQSEQGKLDLYTNPNYKLSQEEEEEARELIDQFWDEHPDLNGIRENGDLKDFYKSYKGEEELTFEEYLRANGIDDMDTYNQAVQYYKLEHKLSNADAFWNGVTEVPYNIGKASESLIDKMCGDSNLSDLYGYDEHDLEIQALCEQQKEDRDLARKASELQNPYAYGAGRASYMLVTSAVAGELLGGTGLVESTASILGGGKAAEKIAEVVLDTVLVDIPTDTVPELIVNLNNGMSKGEALENALENVAENAVINVGADVVLPEVFGAVAKSFDDAGTVKVIGDESEDMLKSSSDSFKIADGNATHNVSSDVVDNLFGEKARNHIETVEGFNKKKGGIIGGHTEEAFKSFSERPVNILSKNKIGDGIYEYTYQVGTLERGVAKTNPDGSFVWYGDTYTKTVINTEELSVDSFEKMAKDAFSKEVIYETESGQLYIKGVMDNGVKVEGYIDKATMELKSYYPCIKYNDNIKIKGEYKYE